MRTGRRLVGICAIAVLAAIGLWAFERYNSGRDNARPIPTANTRNALFGPAAVARGRYDFATGSCISCHALYPISSAGAAIDLTHEGSKRSFAWLQHEIRFPTSRRPPTPSGQADDLAAFLASLK